MNREFKLRFDQMREGDPSKTEETPSVDPLSATGPARTLCLGWPEGKRFFLNYAYLMAGELTFGPEANEIKLYFSTYTVLLRGYGLEPLFNALLEQLPRMIFAIEERYITENDNRNSVVFEIKVETNEK